MPAESDYPIPTEPAEVHSMIRELNHRVNDGIEVTLLWNSKTNNVFVSVAETRYDVSFEFDVAAADALDAFHHPYAYAAQARRGAALAA